MSVELEFHDSTVLEFGTESDEVVVRLRPAYVRKREADGTLIGCTQDVDLRLRRYRSARTAAELPAWISDGMLKIGEKIVFDALIPFPYASTGHVAFSGVTAEGEEFSISADEFVAAPVANRHFVEKIE